MKTFLCPALSAGFYLMYFLLLQLAVIYLPEYPVVSVLVVLSVFGLIPLIASTSSGAVMKRLNKFTCSL